jgi:hypothetical protein
MRYLWYDPLGEASGGEPEFVCWSIALELVDPDHAGTALCATKAKEI